MDTDDIYTDDDLKAAAVAAMWRNGVVNEAFVNVDDAAEWVAPEGDQARVGALIMAMAETDLSPVKWARLRHVTLKDNPRMIAQYIGALDDSELPADLRAIYDPY